MNNFTELLQIVIKESNYTAKDMIDELKDMIDAIIDYDEKTAKQLGSDAIYDIYGKSSKGVSVDDHKKMKSLYKKIETTYGKLNKAGKLSGQ